MSVRRLISPLAILFSTFALISCASADGFPPKKTRAPASLPPPGSLASWLDPKTDTNPFPSTYRPLPSGDVAIVNATVLTAAGPRIEHGRVIISENKIVAVGADVAIPNGARVIDASGKWVTPGIVDGHEHAGDVSIPVGSLRDGLNEATDPNTAQVFIENALWAQSPDWERIREAGVTTMLVLPGSSNEFGGRAALLKMVPATTIQSMKFPDAPYSLKMACGENPTRFYGLKGRNPMTLGGEVAGMRAVFLSGAEYLKLWDDYHAKLARGEHADPPKRDLQLDAIAGVLGGSIRIQMHCYRADDMANMLDMAHEFGFAIAGFHHATEAFKIIPLLRDNGVCVLTWGPDWGGFKMEAYDYTALEPGMIDRAGGCVAIVSDSKATMQHLNVDAARSMAAANRQGLAITEEEALRWITSNPAKALGIDRQTGTLEPGKMADVVIWNRDPFSVYAHAEQVLIDGVEVYRRDDPRYRRPSDFEIDQIGRRNEQ